MAKNKKKIKYARSPIAITVLLMVIGVLLAFLPTFSNRNDGIFELLSALGIELAVSSAVVLITYLFIGEKSESEHIIDLEGKIDALSLALSEILQEQNQLPYLFLNMQNECIQKHCITDRISDYILKSNELSSAEGLFELHIMSNELRQYDFTVISTLAIAMNIQKKVKYIYYLPESSLSDFSQLKSRVKRFIKKDKQAMVEIDSWIRSRILENHNVTRFIQKDISGQRPSEIVSVSFTYLKDDLKKNLQEKLSSLELKGGRIFISEDVFSWIRGETLPDNKASIDNFISIVESINNYILSCGTIYDPIAMRMEEVFSLMIRLYYFSKILVDGEKMTNENDIFNHVFDDEEIVGINQLRNWISTPCEKISEKSIDDILEQNLISIDLSHTPIIKPCYSFCLYVQGNNKRDVSLAWYTCHSDSEGSQRSMDNYITVYAPTPEHASKERDRLIDMYQKVIDYTPGARRMLEEIGSNLLLIGGK